MKLNSSNVMQRSSNFEALRIICMLFIIAGHLIMWHEFDDESIGHIFNCGISSFFMVAVDSFILISGWFGIKYKFSKIIKLNNLTTFWALFLGILAVCVGFHEIMIRRDILMLAPILTRRYWFITVYVALCFLAPYLNSFASSLAKNEFKRLLKILVSLFVLLPTLAGLLNFESITLGWGYEIVNFIVLYLFGRYMKLHASPFRKSLVYFCWYILLMGSCGLFQLAYSRLLGFEFTTFFSYDTFFVFFGAVALFCTFAQLNFKSRVINTLAKCCLAVYVIHMHPWIGNWTFDNFFGMKNISDLLFIALVFVIPVLTFLLCSLMEYCRILISKLLSPIFAVSISSILGRNSKVLQQWPNSNEKVSNN